MEMILSHRDLEIVLRRPGEVAALAFVLLPGDQSILPEQTQGFDDKTPTVSGQYYVRFRAGDAIRQGDRFLQKDIARIRALIHHVQRDPGSSFALAKLPEQGRWPSIGGQQGGMQIQAAPRRKLQ